MKIFSTLRGLLKENLNEPKIFHKNLFLDEFDGTNNSVDNIDSDSDDDAFNQEDDQIFYEDNFETNPKIYELKHLPIPLTDTIAEVLQEFSHDKFLVDDISFIFEMSRKRAISPYALVIALIYLNRLKKKNTSAKSNPVSYSTTSSGNFDKYSASYLTNTELCLVSLLLASKYLIDEGETEEIYNDEWASVSELPVKEINKLEKSFLRQLDWELYVSSDEFWTFTNALTEKITRKKIKLQHNQCTYSDLDVLLSNSSEFSLETAKKYIDLLTKLFFVCSSTIVYIALSSFFVSACIIYIKNQISTHTTGIQRHLPVEHTENTTRSLSPSTVKGTIEDPADSFKFFLNEIDLDQNESDLVGLEKYECNLSTTKNFVHLNFKNVLPPKKRAYLGHIKFKQNYILSKFLL